MARPVRVLLVASHPVQFGAPACRRYVADSRLDICIAHSSLQGRSPASILSSVSKWPGMSRCSAEIAGSTRGTSRRAPDCTGSGEPSTRGSGVDPARTV